MIGNIRNFKFKFRPPEIKVEQIVELTEAELLEDEIVRELILKLSQPEKWLNDNWKVFVYCDRELLFEWKNDDHEKRISLPVTLRIPKRWHSIIQEKVDIIENFLEASKNRFLLSFLRGEFPVKVHLRDKQNAEALDWLLNSIKEDPYYFQSSRNLIWFRSEKIATFCKTALG